MAEYKLKHTGAVIDQQIDRVLDGSVVVENTLSALDLESKKPVDSMVVAKESERLANMDVIHLSKFEVSPTIEKAGDWVCNKVNYAIVTKDVSGNLIYREKNRSQLYLWQNELYEWNNNLTALVKIDNQTSWLLSNVCEFTNSTFYPATGGTTGSKTRIFSSYIPLGMFYAKEGYKIAAVAYYNAETLVYDSAVQGISVQSYNLDKAGCVARVLIRKDDGAEFTPEDYLDGNIINAYINGKIKEIQADVETIQKTFIQTEQVIPMKFGKLSGGRIYIPSDTALYDDFFYHLHSALYSVDKVSELGLSFQKIDIERTFGQVIRISKASDSTSASIGDEVVFTPKAAGGWYSAQIPVKSGETYVVSGLGAGGMLPLVAVVNSSNILVQKVNGNTGVTTVTVNVEEDGQMIINQDPSKHSSASQIQELALQYHYYNDRYSYLGEFGVNIPDNAKYLRLSSTSDTPYESEHSVILPYIGTMSKSKESGNPLSVGLAYYPVYLHNQNADNEAEDTLQDLAELTYDQIKFILPPNYNPSGDPVRLVIYVQGSGGSVWTDRTFNGSGAQSRATYLAQEGYAVMMINGITAKYHTLYPEVNDNFATPTGMACYMQAYKWMLDNYNIKTDGIFVYGKSLGGVGVGNILYSKLPVLAAAGLAPVLDCISEVMRNRDAQAKQFYADQFGMTGDITFSNRPVSSDNQKLENAFFKANANKAIGYNPLWNGTIGLDTDTLLDKTYEYGVIKTGTELADERLLYEALPKYLPAPLKIWIAKDDVNVDPRFCDYMKKMCQKGGSIYRLRWMPEDTGGHWAVDNGSEVNGVFQEPVRATIKPRYYSGEVTQPVAFIEMVSWFRRFES